MRDSKTQQGVEDLNSSDGEVEGIGRGLTSVSPGFGSHWLLSEGIEDWLLASRVTG